MKLWTWIGTAIVALVAGTAVVIFLSRGMETQDPPALLVQIARAFPDGLFFKETSDRVVALTIDDVPGAADEGDQATQVILDAIGARNEVATEADQKVFATFFIISSHLRNGSTVLARIAADGHELANHGEADATAATLTREEFASQLQTSHQRLAQFTDQPIRWYRPGRGLFTPAMAEALRLFPGYEPRFALASMLPVDTFKPADDPRFSAWFIEQHIFPGAILVLHGGTMEQSRQTAMALALILPELARRGYRVVTLSQLWDLS